MPTSTRSKSGTSRSGAGRRFPTSSGGQSGTRRFASSSGRASAGRSTGRTRRTQSGRRPTPDLGLSTALRKRKTPKRTGVSKALTGLMSSGAAKKATPSSKKGKGGGVAVLAAGAGLAYKNREKLMGMLKGGKEQSSAPVATTNTANATPVHSVEERPVQ